MTKRRPACTLARRSALRRVVVKPLRRRHGTPLTAFFNTPKNENLSPPQRRGQVP
ncbi:MAG: hypothetical protein ABIU05_20750 [Nitrospirales bacterium]